MLFQSFFQKDSCVFQEEVNMEIISLKNFSETFFFHQKINKGPCNFVFQEFANN